MLALLLWLLRGGWTVLYFIVMGKKPMSDSTAQTVQTAATLTEAVAAVGTALVDPSPAAAAAAVPAGVTLLNSLDAALADLKVKKVAADAAQAALDDAKKVVSGLRTDWQNVTAAVEGAFATAESEVGAFVSVVKEFAGEAVTEVEKIV